jgi:hypothetical protein
LTIASGGTNLATVVILLLEVGGVPLFVAQS